MKVGSLITRIEGIELEPCPPGVSKFNPPKLGVVYTIDCLEEATNREGWFLGVEEISFGIIEGAELLVNANKFVEVLTPPLDVIIAELTEPINNLQLI